MSGQEGHDGQPYDSDNDFEKPKDDFMFYYNAFKIEEKKMCSHLKFEEITTKYWQLLKQSHDKDYNTQGISQELYTELMRRIYKVLLPLYRDNEMREEIKEEWLVDSKGQSELTFQLMTKVLFRIAHQWCTNIDIEEYVDFLQKIYDRITFYESWVSYAWGGGYNSQVFPEILITFPYMEKKIQESGGKIEKTETNEDWLECRSEESNRSEFEYKYEQDEENMQMKKYKKPKGSGDSGLGVGGGPLNQVIKDPIIFQEDVELKFETQYSYLPKMIEMEQLNPLGYLTEKYLTELKTSVIATLDAARQERLANQKGLPRDQRDNSNLYVGINDSELLEENGNFINKYTYTHDYKQVRIYFSDIAHNNLRKMLREGLQMALRMYNPFPKGTTRSKSRAGLSSNEPILEINKFGYNPALERRLNFKIEQTEYGKVIQNVSYHLDRPEYVDSYRRDIQKIETKDKLCLKENDDIRKEEEFNCVETTYKKLRQIMLYKKFESIYIDRSNADNKEQKRLKKLIEKEEKRKANALKHGNIAQKGLGETYEEKSFIKMMKGPFYQLDSKDGLQEDDFVTCAEKDLIDAARTQAMRILIIGKPRSGKTNLCINLAKKLDLVHISIDNWITALLAKIKAYEPPELEEGQEAPKWLSELEEGIHLALLQGGGPTDDQQVEIIREQIKSPAAVLKGYLLDLSYYNRENSWASTIRQRHLLGEPDDMGHTVDFSHIVELWCEDEDVKLRADHMRVFPEDGVVYSKWERDERRKPKKVSEEDEPVEEENEIKPLDEAALVQRSCDTDERIKEELHYYNTVERPAMEELLINFFDNQYIKLDSGGLTPDELVECVTCRIKQDDQLPLRPIAVKIEGAGDFKSLLTEGLEENHLPRKWSLWRKTDPVALSQGKVIEGQAEFAAHYHGNVFVFSSEENLVKFLAEPKKYLQDRPVMPSNFRALMLGPKGVGKHTQAQLLNETYGWTIVDYKELVRAKLEELMKFEIHIPNNPVQGGRIGLSEQELQDISEGKPMPAWKFIPWIFDYLGYALDKKKPPPPEEKQEEEQQEEEPPQLSEAEMKKKMIEEKKKREEEERKKKEEEDLQKFKEDRRRRRQEAIESGQDPIALGIEDSEEEPIIIEDLSIDQLVLKEDEATGKLPFVGGFILIGYPETEEHINRLKAHGIEFDRIICLNDTNEEEPGAEIKKRMKDQDLFDWDWELENSNKILALAKEHLGEDIVREISCNGKIDDVLIRIRNEIDPFYIKVDVADDVRVSADLSEEDKKLPKGDFGDYCPVTYVKDNWIVRGNPEQEVTVFGKTYWLSGEKEAELFKFNPKQFLVTQYGNSPLPLAPPPPRIMIMGHRGAGTTTQIRMLCEKYKLEEFELKKSYIAKLDEEKEKRKRRRLLDRGFGKPAEPDEEGNIPPDPEIEEDPEDFEKEAHEREVMKLIYDNQKGYVIDGCWRDLPEGRIGQNLQDLLFESRRVPEIVIILKCKEKATFDRIIDREAIRAVFNQKMEARDAERKKVRDEERRAYIEEITKVGEDEEAKQQSEIDELLNTWDEQRDQQEKDQDENDPEMPNYDAMEGEYREKLVEQRTADDTLFEEFGQALKDKQVFVIDDIKSDMSAEFVHIKLLDKIKDNFLNRKDIIERQLAQPLKPEEVKYFEQSHIYKHSKFGHNSPLEMSNPTKTKKHTVLYRERLYFLSNEEQRLKFLKEPSKYALSVETVPTDIGIKPKLFIIGYPKSGKSTLCRKLQEKSGIVHLKIPQIVDQFIDRDSFQFHSLRKQMKLEGRQIEDDQLVNLIIKRIQYKDCQQNGWILEDFPKTRNQALFLAKRGIVPNNVIVLRLTQEVILLRSTLEQLEQKFGHFHSTKHSRMKVYEQNVPHVISFYQKLYNNVIDINGQRSKWFVEDKTVREISKNLEARQQFAKDYYLRERDPRACKIRNLNIDRILLKQSLSEFKYYCPVTWKNEKLLVKCSANKEDCVLYKNAFYYFKGTQQRDMFISNPARFILNVTLPKPSDLPLRVFYHKAAEILVHEKTLSGHCSITLMDEERVKKGDPLLLILFRDNKYVFDSEYKLQRFLANPFKYAKATLPVKMPPPEDKISLFNLQKMEDSIAFMEQSLGQCVTRGLREVSENRLKHPGMSVKETMLKLFALFLKTENPANTPFMKKKYQGKMKEFIQRCELPEELFDLGNEKGNFNFQVNSNTLIEKKKPRGDWPQFKEKYYNEVGARYDQNLKTIEGEKLDNFMNYLR